MSPVSIPVLIPVVIPEASAKVRVLVVDDEPLARDTLRLLLGADRDVIVVGECAQDDEARRRIAEVDPDVIFLDVQMPGGSGFDLLAALGESRRAEVIFVTAFDEHALRAFEVRALDYLLKPFDDERFAEALGRAKERVRKTRLEALARRMGALASATEPSPLAKVAAAREARVVWRRARSLPSRLGRRRSTASSSVARGG